MQPFDWMREIGWKLEARLNRALRVDTYEVRDDSLVKHLGLWSERRVQLREISSWFSVPEMSFDIVVIMLKNGEKLVWSDYYDDLLPPLRRFASDREVNSQ